MLCDQVLYCTVLYCTVLYCTVLSLLGLTGPYWALLGFFLHMGTNRLTDGHYDLKGCFRSQKWPNGPIMLSANPGVLCEEATGWGQWASAAQGGGCHDDWGVQQ